VDLHLDDPGNAVLNWIFDGDDVDGLVDILGEQFTLGAILLTLLSTSSTMVLFTLLEDTS
jgi:uncharacterized membrane protein